MYEWIHDESSLQSVAMWHESTFLLSRVLAEFPQVRVFCLVRGKSTSRCVERVVSACESCMLVWRRLRGNALSASQETS